MTLTVFVNVLLLVGRRGGHTLLAWLAVLSAVVGLAGYVPYVRDLCRPSETRPDPTLWGIWLLEYASLVAAQAREGAGLALFLPASQLVGVAIVFSLSLRLGACTISRQMAALLACVLIALTCWWLISSAVVAILLLTAIENSAMWGAASAAGVIGILALGPSAPSILYAYRLGVCTISRQRVLLLACVLAALTCWWLSSSAVIAILLLIAIENSAVVATIAKVWQEPHSENLAMWGAASAAGVIGILALGPSAPSILYAYPASLALMTGLVVVVATARRKTMVLAQAAS